MTLKLKKLALLALLPLFVSCQSEDLPVASNDWKLVWEDDFDSTQLDLNKWTVETETGSQYGLDYWGNNEFQYYQEENISFEDGEMVFTGKLESRGDRDYTSARIHTRDKASWKYGKMEARIKMDEGQGVWTAFWMLPQDASSGWPESGEIDIMEYVGHNRNEYFGTVHYGNPWGFQGGKDSHPNLSEDFHTYGIEWEENRLEWFFDGEPFFSMTPSELPEGINWPFNHEFYIILNMALGGNLANNEVNNAILPVTMEIDYVRVYQKNVE